MESHSAAKMQPEGPAPTAAPRASEWALQNANETEWTHAKTILDRRAGLGIGRRAGLPRSRLRCRQPGEGAAGYARPERLLVHQASSGHGRTMAASAGRGRAADHLSRRHDGQRGRHGSPHAAGPVAGRDADRDGPGGDRAGRHRPPKHADDVPLAGGSGLHRREVATDAGKAPGGKGIRGAVLGRYRLGPVLLQATHDPARRFAEDQVVRLGGQRRRSGQLPLGRLAIPFRWRRWTSCPACKPG